jgi:hypothetical protein
MSHRDGDTAPVVQHLPSKLKAQALSSVTSTKQERKETKKRKIMSLIFDQKEMCIIV